MVRFWAALRLPAPWRAARAAEIIKKKEHLTLSVPEPRDHSLRVTTVNIHRCSLPLLHSHTGFKTYQKVSLQYHCVIISTVPFIAYCHWYTTNLQILLTVQHLLKTPTPTLKTRHLLKEIKLHNELMLTHEWAASTWLMLHFLKATPLQRVDDLSFAMSSFPYVRAGKTWSHCQTGLFSQAINVSRRPHILDSLLFRESFKNLSCSRERWNLTRPTGTHKNKRQKFSLLKLLLFRCWRAVLAWCG